MKQLFAAFFLATFSSFAFADAVILKESTVSCIRVVENGNDYHETAPELFFWDENVAITASNLLKSGYKLSRRIDSDVLCGGYTPNIQVSSRKRKSIKKAINSYRPIIEDGQKIWVDDIEFKK